MPRHALSALASAATHAAAVLLLLILAQITRQTVVTTPANSFETAQIFLPSIFDGGGRSSGGDRSEAPARKLELPGRDQRSAPSTPDRSTASAVDQPLDIIPLDVQPIGHGVTQLAGPVTSERAADSLGPNLGRGGDGDGPKPGDGAGPGRGFGDGIGRRGPGVTTPVVITQVKPGYTPEAMRAKVQGIVMVECVVLPDGTVGDARVVRSLDPRFGLDQEAIAAAKKWRFKPGLLNGTPVPVVVTIELSFTLR